MVTFIVLAVLYVAGDTFLLFSVRPPESVTEEVACPYTGMF